MGKAKLRSQLAKELKRIGISRKLHYGSGRIAKKFYDAKTLMYMLFLLSTIGKVVYDCDGHNHRVKKVLAERRNWIRNNTLIYFDQLEFEDGRWSCGCGSGPDSAIVREILEKDFLEWCGEEDIRKKRPKFVGTIEPILKAGGHIFDDDGILLPEIRKIRDEEIYSINEALYNT